MILLYEIIACCFKLFLTYVIIHYFGFILGFILCYCIFKIHKILMKMIFDLDYLKGLDVVFISQNERERFNIIGFMTFEHFNAAAIKEMLIEKGLKKMKKLRVRMVFKYFAYYWEEVPLEEAINRITVHPRLKNEEEVYDYVSREMNIHIDIFTHPPYEISIIPYGNENKGAVTLKYDHIMSDGLGMVSLLCCLAGNYSEKIFPKIMRDGRQETFIQKIVDYVTFPLFGILALYEILSPNSVNTPFRNRDNPSTRSKFSFSRCHQLSSFSKVRKAFNVTFNDVMISVISMSLKRIFSKDKEYANLKNVRCVIPIGKKSIPKTIYDIQICNDANGVLTHIPLIDNINECKIISEHLQKSIKSIRILSAYYRLASLICEYFPAKVLSLFAKYYISNLDFILTNVPGPTEDLDFAGCHCTMMVPVSTAGYSLSFLPLVSYGNQFRFVFTVNEASKVEPNEFIQTIDQVIDEISEYKTE